MGFIGFKPILLAAFIILIASGDSFAYLDPGTGSYMLQLLIAGLLGAGFAVKAFWKNIKSFLYGIFTRSGREEKGS